MKKVNREKNKSVKGSNVFTKETFGVVIILFATLCAICLITGDKLFSVPGAWVSSFLYGCFGYFAIVLCAFAIVMGVFMLMDKKLGGSKKRKSLIIGAVVTLALLLHLITMHGFNGATYGEYLAASYNMGAGGLATCSGGGVITALVAYCVSGMLTQIGGYVVLGAGLLALGYFIVRDFMGGKKGKVKEEEHRSSFVKAPKEGLVSDYELSGTKDYPVEGAKLDAPAFGGTQKLFVVGEDSFGLKSKKDVKNGVSADIKISSTSGGMSVGMNQAPVQPSANTHGVAKPQPVVNPASSLADAQTYKEKLDYIRTPAQINIPKYDEPKDEVIDDVPTPTVSVSSPIVEEKIDDDVIPNIEHDDSDDAVVRARDFNSKYASFEDLDAPAVPPEPEVSVRSVPSEIFDDVDEIEEPKVEEEIVPKEEPSARPVRRSREILGFISKEDKLVEDDKTEEEISESVLEEVSQAVEDDNDDDQNFRFEEYVRPPLNLLATYEKNNETPPEEHQFKMAKIEETLRQFKIDASVEGYVQGPTITRYEITMPSGKSVKEILKYEADLAMYLKAENGIRIEAPIPGMDRVGVEVENKVKTKVGLRSTMEGMSSVPMKQGELRFAIGQDLLGNAIFDDLAKGPHYLVAGSTGSGKSVCLHAMIISMIMTYGPEDLRLILVNPKHVEFQIYKGLPHLLIDEILNTSNKASAALAWAHAEMVRRGELFKENADLVVDIDGYNKYIANDKIPKLPRIVIIIDEYAELVGADDATAQKELNAKVASLAQMSRSAGIHLVLATQRPTTNIVTGTIKTNLPSRIALKLTNATDSITILDEGGAEKLLGWGDMLYRNANMSNTKRYQGAYLDRVEMKNVISFIKENNATHFDKKLTEMVENVVKKDEEVETFGSASISPNEQPSDRNLENDDRFIRCLAYGVRKGMMSISSLQRNFPMGYPTAAKIFDKMDSLGYLSPFEGSKPRKMLLTVEEFEKMYGPISDYGV